jgi:hypothetical protein
VREYGDQEDNSAEFSDRDHEHIDKKHTQTEVPVRGQKVVELHPLLLPAPKNIFVGNFIIHKPRNEPLL